MLNCLKLKFSKFKSFLKIISGSYQGKLESAARHLMETGYQQQLTYKLVIKIIDLKTFCKPIFKRHFKSNQI